MAEPRKSARLYKQQRLPYCAALSAGSADWRSIDDAPSQPATTTSTVPAIMPISHSSGCGR